jgi:hypothetical protein
VGVSGYYVQGDSATYWCLLPWTVPCAFGYYYLVSKIEQTGKSSYKSIQFYNIFIFFLPPYYMKVLKARYSQEKIIIKLNNQERDY